MTTAEFIDALEQQRIVDGDLARQLRGKVADDGARVGPDAILKFLVKTDVITQWKADELAALMLAPPPADDDEILDLAPLPEFDDRPSARPAAAPIDASGPPPGPGVPGAERGPLFSSKAVTLDESSLESLAADQAGGAKRPGVYSLSKGGGKKKRSTKKRTASGKNQWDSPLLLLGGGALAILVVGGALLYYLLIRENASAVLNDANQLFAGGAYSQAIARYEEFVGKFSNHKDISQARVRLQMTRLWESVESMSDPAASLDVAQQVITAVEHEPAFVSSGEGEQGLSEAKQELGRLLVRIGEALIAEAEEAADAADVVRLIEKTEAVLALSANNKYVPEQVRNQPALAEISESLAVIRARQQRDSRLAATLTKMDQAVSAGDTSAAYAERLTLLAEFPALADHESLAAKVREVSAAEQAGVRFVAGERPAETSWPARAVVAELALAERRPLAAGPQPGAPVVVRVDGALYGLASGDGALLWRRFAGFGSAGAPLMIGGDVVAANLEAGELWRLNASTGKLVWRLPLEDQITGVVAAGARLLATAASGKLFVVNAADGALAGHVEFTQPIRTAPAVNERGDRIYVIAEHSIAYTLSGDDFSCIGVYYLGHAAGAVLAPPIALLNKVVVADNSGSDGSRLRVLTLDGRGVPDKEAASDRLAGIITTPLARAGRRLAAVTARGQVAVVEVSGAADQSALINVARREGQEPEALARFALLHDGKLWLAARQLSKLAILPTENQLSVESLDRNYLGSAFDGLLQSAGKLVIHVHRPAGRAGAVVAATDSATNRAVWETAIAVPLATAPMVDASRGRIVATTASGAAFILDRQALARGVQDASSRAVGSVGDGAPLTLGVAAPDGRQLVGALGSSQILLVAPDEPRPVRTIELASPLSGPLAAWGDGALAPTEVGQVFAIPAGETSDAITPFQPQLVPGRKYAWLEPSAVGAGEAPPFLVSDGAERLYLVELRAEGTRYFQEAKSVDVGPAPLATPLVVVGSVALAGTGDGRLARFALPDLAPSEPVELGGQVAWGPFPVAVEGSAAALLATDADELMLISQEGEVRWRRPLAHGPLAGKPLVAASGIFTLSGGGGIARIDPADGTEVGFADLHQPATVGPVPLGERLLVAGPDGGLMVVNRP